MSAQQARVYKIDRKDFLEMVWMLWEIEDVTNDDEFKPIIKKYVAEKVREKEGRL
jgi:hypothetical protein